MDPSEDVEAGVKAKLTPAELEAALLLRAEAVRGLLGEATREERFVLAEVVWPSERLRALEHAAEAEEVAA